MNCYKILMLAGLFCGGMLAGKSIDTFRFDGKPESGATAAELLTPLEQLSYRDHALRIGGAATGPAWKIPGWHGDEGTVAYWIKPLNWRGDDGSSMVFWHPSPETGSGEDFLFYKHGSGDMLLFHAQKGEHYTNPWAAAGRLAQWMPDQWHHIAIQWERGKFFNIYLDGVLTDRTPADFAGFPRFDSFQIGVDAGTPWSQAESLIREVKVADYPVSDAEISMWASPDAITAGGICRLPLAAMILPPTIDGKLEEGEYPGRIWGLCDNSTFKMYEDNASVAMGRDRDNVYFAAMLQLPPGYEPKSASGIRNDKALVAEKDFFNLFLSCQPDAKNPKKRKGLYFCLAPNNVSYCGLEEVDWETNSCLRTSEGLPEVKAACRIEDGVWSVEAVIPRSLVPWLEQADAQAAIGFALGGKRLSLQPQPNWFDDWRGGGTPVWTDVSVQETGRGWDSGDFAMEFQLEAPHACEATYRMQIADAALQRKAERMNYDQMVGVSVDVDEGSVLWQDSGKIELKPGAPQTKKGSVHLKQPALYNWKREIATDGATIYSREMPFEYFPVLTMELGGSPERKLIRCQYKCRLPEDRLQNAVLQLDFQTDGKIAWTRRLSDIGVMDEREIPMTDLPPGEYTVTARVLDENGSPLAAQELPFLKTPREEWRENPVALEALTPDWCPEPWTPVTFSAATKQIGIWGRSYDFSSGIFAQITSQGETLLAASAVVKYRLTGAHDVHELSQNRTQGEILGAGLGRVIQEFEDENFRLKVTHQIEFDGFDLIRCELAPRKELALEALWIEFPFHNLPLLSTDGYCGLFRAGEYGAQRMFWLGNDRVSFTFGLEDFRGWFIDSRKPRWRLEKQADGTDTVSLLIANEPGTLSRELDFQWFVYAGPLKPLPEGWRAWRKYGWDYSPSLANIQSIAPNWNGGYSRPSPANWLQFDHMIDYLHRRGQKCYPYLAPATLNQYLERTEAGMADTQFPFTIDPAFGQSRRDGALRVEEFWVNNEDWPVRPIQYINDGSGMETRDMVWMDFNCSYADFFVWSIAEMLKNSDIDGFYFDLLEAKTDFNAEKGYTYQTRDGQEEGFHAELAMRRLFKRFYFLFEQYRGTARRPYLLLHATHSFHCADFGDVLFHGEGISYRKPFDVTAAYLMDGLVGFDVARSEQAGVGRSYNAWSFRSFYNNTAGTPSMFLPQYGFRQELAGDARLSREMLGMTLVHDVLIWAIYTELQTIFDFWNQVTIPWGMEDTEFSGYWENGATATPDCVRVSWYKKKDREDYLVCVVNFSDAPVRAEVRLPQPLAALSNVCDYESKEDLPFPGGQLSLTVPAHDFRVVRLR